MDLRNILKMDGYKVFIILIFLVIPHIVGYIGHSNVSGKEYNISADEIHMGFPYSYIDMEYENIDDASAYIPRFNGNFLNFILDVIIAYLIGIFISFVYYRLKK